MSAGLPPYASLEADGTMLLRVKVVPAASRDQLAGVLGNRLKVQVKAPPEAGRANHALRELLAGALRLPPTAIEIVRGADAPLKLVRLQRIPAQWPRAGNPAR